MRALIYLVVGTFLLTLLLIVGAILWAWVEELHENWKTDRTTFFATLILGLFIISLLSVALLAQWVKHHPLV